MGDVDVLFVPIGGGDGLTPTGATEVIGQIEPRLVIPMRYRFAEDEGQARARRVRRRARPRRKCRARTG